MTCAVCHREAQPSTPGVMHVEYFYNVNCEICGTQGNVCGTCNHNELVYSDKLTCKVCKRDLKINDLIYTM